MSDKTADNTPTLPESEASDLAGSGTVDAVVATCPAMDLEMGFFFDGTGNNSGNISVGNAMRESGNAHSEDSYNNDYSNVEKLWRQYRDKVVENDCEGIAKLIVKEYIPGIGTETGDDDSTKGFALGWGQTGVAKRVEDTFLLFLRHVNEAKARGEVKSITLDVFGFSRGSAAARHFVNCVHRGITLHGYSGPYYEVQDEDKPKIKFRFLGLFDCVVSVGIVADDDNHGTLRIGLRPDSAEKIVHLIAMDEFRKNFSLTQTPDGSEIIPMPGAHSDIGGGYPAHWVDDTLLLRDMAYTKTRHMTDAEIAALQMHGPQDAPVFADLVARGWLLPSDTEAYRKVYTPLLNNRPNDPYSISTYMTRPWVDHRLSRIALYVMHKKAIDAGVPFPLRLPNNDLYNVPDGTELAAKHNVPAENLRPIAVSLANGGSVAKNGPLHKFLRRNYVHYSSSWKPRMGFLPMRPQENNERRVWPNKISEAQ